MTDRLGRGGCVDCGRRYGDEYGFPDLLIPNWAFEKINGSRNGLLCPCCIIRRLADHGLTDVPFAFTSGPLQRSTIKLSQPKPMRTPITPAPLVQP